MNEHKIKRLNRILVILCIFAITLTWVFIEYFPYNFLSYIPYCVLLAFLLHEEHKLGIAVHNEKVMIKLIKYGWRLK